MSAVITPHPPLKIHHGRVARQGAKLMVEIYRLAGPDAIAKLIGPHPI